MADNYVITEDGELRHYGVLGMKWGVRRAAKKGTTYSYKSMSTHRYEKKEAKARSKGNSVKADKYAKRLARSKELDAKEQKIAEEMSTAKVLATRYFTMGVGSKQYLRFRAMGDSKAKALLKSAVFTGTNLDLLQKARYLRQDE